MSRPPANPDQPSSDPDKSDSTGSRVPAAARPADRSRRPPGVVFAAVVVALEATALLAAAVWYAFELFSGAPVLTFWGAVFTLALLLAFSAWLFAVGHFLFRGYRWTRAAALVAQLFVLIIGVPTMTGGLVLQGAAMAIPALAVVVILFRRDVIAYASQTAGASAAL
ncbi:hypothetical protein [Arthrobacter sp. fls2-241-R2A-200]|uniref:hypothetical protein n=1 Tax=Arthrobacter sp. fls2-241-R2A-200 TaxID=3040281 RepID=UPI00254FEC9A|nr:hypothetical protein [Arthrobacter sp. fls2-241-R2A-200]